MSPTSYRREPLNDRVTPLMPSRNKAARAYNGDALTRRELEILALLATGDSTRDIAAKLGVAPSTIKTHLSSVYKKIGTRNRVQAARYYLDNHPPAPLAQHRDAQLSPALTAHVLSTVTGLVPCRLALFWSVTRRMEVVLAEASQAPATAIDAETYVALGRSVGPFAPSRAARMGASLLTVDDAGGARRLADSAYGRQLDRAGLQHQVALYLRVAGELRGMIALFRAHGAPAFSWDDMRVLRQLHPLVEHGYACGLAPSAAASSPIRTGLTRGAADVAALG